MPATLSCMISNAFEERDFNSYLFLYSKVRIEKDTANQCSRFSQFSLRWDLLATLVVSWKGRYESSIFFFFTFALVKQNLKKIRNPLSRISYKCAANFSYGIMCNMAIKIILNWTVETKPRTLCKEIIKLLSQSRSKLKTYFLIVWFFYKWHTFTKKSIDPLKKKLKMGVSNFKFLDALINKKTYFTMYFWFFWEYLHTLLKNLSKTTPTKIFEKNIP